MCKLLPLVAISVLLASCGGGSGAPLPAPSTYRAYAVTGDALYSLVLSGPGGDEKKASLSSTDSITDLAWDGESLYAVTFSRLIKINPATGLITVVGEMGVGSVNALAASPSGTLYAADMAGTLYRLDPATGRATPLTTMGKNSSGDLAFVNESTLYATVRDTYGSDALIQVDLAMQKTTFVGSIGYTEVYGLDFQGNTLFGLTNSGQLLTVNTTTGVGTLVRDTGLQFTGMQ